MAKFLYKAKNEKGETVTGTVQAPNQYEAERVLFKNKLVAEEIARENALGISLNLKSRITVKDRAIMARQLATMIEAGLTLTKSVSIVATQARTERMKEIYHAIYRDLEEGYTFSSSLAKHPDAFDKVFVSVVKSGETTGNLEVVLSQLAERLENDSNFVAKIRGAMYYPCFILLALIGISGYMMVAVIPQLKGIFEQSGAELPIATKMLLSLSDFMTRRWWLALIILVLVIFIIIKWIRSDVGGETINRWQLRIPGIKNLSMGLYMSRFSRILEMLIKAGVPLLDALRITATTMNNRILEDGVLEMAVQVERGVPLSVPIQKNKEFPNIVGQMVSVGEQTGKLDKVLEKVATYYEEETTNQIKALSTLIEPVILLIIGAGVAFLIFAILVPIYSIAQLQ